MTFNIKNFDQAKKLRSKKASLMLQVLCTGAFPSPAAVKVALNTSCLMSLNRKRAHSISAGNFSQHPKADFWHFLCSPGKSEIYQIDFEL